MYALCLPGVNSIDAALRLGVDGGLAWLDGGPEFGDAGRWSFLAHKPVEEVRVPYGSPDPLSVLDKLSGLRDPPSELTGAPPPSRVPRWVGYIAYDAFWSGCRRSLAPLWDVPVLC